ncbi:hypothetical protein AAC387_Pa05g1423 [Persea americana]
MDKHRNRTGDVEGLELSSRGKRSASTRSSGFTKTEDANMKKKKGMVLPFVPLSLAFDNIKYSIDMPPEMKKRGIQDDRLMLLKGVSGAFRPGVLTALMGVSGAGKTTLMDVLAGRKTSGYIEGNISISVDSATRKMFIEEVMELVELTSLRESLVGLPGLNGLSTEQRKRLTIAVELVANPSIIFMDEPTSGLDARVAAIVMRTVRNTVDTGRTVVCTIHQPSIDIFESFDELCLIKRGGEEIYVAPLGHHSYHLIKYFESINGVSKVKDGYNPATWMLEVTTTSQEEIPGVKFADIYKNSNLYQRNKAVIKELSSPPPGSKDLYFPTHFDDWNLGSKTGVSDRICSMQWAPCMLQYFSLEYEMAHLCNQSWPLNEQSSIGKGLLGCILPYHMLLHRLQSRFHMSFFKL